MITFPLGEGGEFALIISYFLHLIHECNTIMVVYVLIKTIERNLLKYVQSVQKMLDNYKNLYQIVHKSPLHNRMLAQTPILTRDEAIELEKVIHDKLAKINAKDNTRGIGG